MFVVQQAHNSSWWFQLYLVLSCPSHQSGEQNKGTRMSPPLLENTIVSQEAHSPSTMVVGSPVSVLTLVNRFGG